MFVNAHAHVFNLQTVLTEEAITILVGRLRRYGVHEAILEGLGDFLWAQLLRPEHLTEEALLRRFLRAITSTAAFRQFADGLAGLPVEVQLLGTAGDALAVDVLRAALDKLSRLLGDDDAATPSVFDLYETLRLVMQPAVVDVADRLLAPLGPDDVLVALMMDIVAVPEQARDRANFLAQLKGTSEAAVLRPGRLLPFVAVNPLRTDHFDHLETAVMRLGFVGVKLYPSLGFDVGSPEIRRVLAYCVEHDVPVLVHATRGGFFRSEATRDFSDPARWRPLLDAFPDLRVCFAHFGGWGGFSGQVPEQAAWADTILALMRAHAGVYTDLSFHVEMMPDAAASAAYFDALRALLADGVAGTRILFGTDGWLVRMRVTEAAYWACFREALSAAEFRQIAAQAPRAFLGLPDAAGRGMRPNVARHVAFLEANRARAGAVPAAWVGTVSDAVFMPVRGTPGWSPNHRAHVLTYQFVRFETSDLPPALRGLTFAGAAPVRLRQLAYYTKDHGDPDLYAQARRATALKLDAFLRHNGAVYEGDYSREDVVRLVDRLLDDGDRTLAEFAAAVDALYLFASELP